MKTSEEWSKWVDENPRNHLDIDAWFVELVKAIQADARHAALTEVAHNARSVCKSQTDSDAVERFILDLRDKEKGQE